MSKSLTVADVTALFESVGTRLYGGEAITQSQHGLQAAWLAEQSGAGDALVIACLLHDLGHMIFEQGNDDLASGMDDLHQFRVLPFLRDLVPSSVIETIRLHVDAKRYLCWKDASYRASLSPASQASLALQGGVMSDAEARDFEAQPQYLQAIALRHCDDAAKIRDLQVPPLAHYLPRLQAMAEKAALQ